MKAILIRVGVDQAYGQWNAPIDPESGHFVYVPIPEQRAFRPGLKRSYREVLPALQQFALRLDLDRGSSLGLPRSLLDRAMHLDPDFEWLTYGDNGDKRGAGIKHLSEGDLLVFYAGLKPVRASRKLIYGLVGLYVVDKVLPATSVLPDQYQSNAHTRVRKIAAADIVVRAKVSISGRLTKCVPIGEWRDRAYRVTPGLLKKWGGLSVKDGYIQRSARPPAILNARKFYRWFLRQEVELIQRNNLMPGEKVIIVHLRRPRRRSDMRDDPFWEFGSFGITGCHARNLLHPKTACDLKGIRLAFAQGGKLGTRLVFLSLPVRKVVTYRDRSEAIWSPRDMPFRYEHAPLLIDNKGGTKFPLLKRLLRVGKRHTWIGQFGSNFRTSKEPLSDKVAHEMVRVYDQFRRSEGPSGVAQNYVDALPVQREPCPPPQCG